MPKRKQRSLWIVLFVCLSFLFVSDAYAHKVRVFAYGEGDTIIGETAFSGGRAAKGSKIIVRDADSEKILSTCITDDHGNFHFPIPEEARKKRLDLKIIVSVGEGHRGEWLLETEDYLESSKEGDEKPEETVTAVPSPVGSVEKQVAGEDERIRNMMEEVLDQKLAPIKHMLSRSQDRGPTLQDILGGIGYLLGLAGLAAYIQSKKKK